MPQPLDVAVQHLRAHYGSVEGPPTRDPFELILLENVAYLATPARRREAFQVLKATVGTDPKALVAATPKALEVVTAKGILKGTFAEKLRTCGRLALERFNGDLRAVLEGPLPQAKKALRAFPGIGEPGADAILLFMGRHACLAPDSNGLRVLVRLGWIREEKAYAKTYAAACTLEADLLGTPASAEEAHLLLQHHGRTLCTRKDPACGICPLSGGCAFAQGGGRKD